MADRLGLGELRALRLLVLGLPVALMLITGAPASFAQSSGHAPDELLVGFRAGVSQARAHTTYAGMGATKVEELSEINVHRIHVPPAALNAIQSALSRRPEVKFVEPNVLGAPSFYPDDPSFPDEWHLFRINAQQAWDITPGAPGIVVAILDSGVEATHPDLQAHLVPGYNFVDNNTNTADVNGHGTRVAGAAAAIGNNGVGVSGVAMNASIMPIRVSDSSGYASWSAVAKGITWAVDHGARVLNVSTGGNIAQSSTVSSAAQYARSHGAVVFAASGNCGCYDSTPDNPYIIDVGATDASDNLAGFSSQGPYVDISAPGVSIITPTIGGGYATVSGTSHASPVAAGVAALVLAANPQLNASDVERVLKSTAVDLGAQGWDPAYGAGRVDAYRAVAAALGSTSVQDTTPPSVAITSPQNGSTLSGGVTVSVSASDNSGVARTDLYINNTLYASDGSAPFQFYLDTTSYSNGTDTLTAKAVDLAGNVAVSSPVTLTISNSTTTSTGNTGATGDTTAPTVNIDTISQQRNKVAANVSGSDASGVVKAELYIDGKLVATATSLPTTFSLPVPKIGPGTHVFTAKAYDSAGNVGSSSPVSFTTK
jgi:subtilisin family serine protease